MAKESKITFCPNCRQPAVREDNQITCETCDATYTITKTEGAKVRSQGRLQSLEDRVAKIEAELPGVEPDEPAQDGPPAETDDDKDNEDIL